MPPKKTSPKPVTLNEEQQAVVNFGVGMVSVVAGPGSGKSSAATQRYVRLIKEGISPDQVLCLSFTQTAAKNLSKRVEDSVGKLEFTRTAGSRTFHSLSLCFAQEERDEFDFTLAEFPLATEPLANKLSGEAARRYEIDPRSLRPYISLAKRRRIPARQAVRDAEEALNAKELKLALAYKDYDKRCKENGVLDFDSLMYQMVEILSKKKDVRDRWQYQFVMCDEAQDCCITDWQLLRLITEKHGNLCVVGDPGQSVFGFRGAQPDLFLKMDEMFPDTQKLFLATNYRSSQELVEFLKEIGPVPELSCRFHTPNEHGPKPVVQGFLSSGDEAKWVVSKIKESE